MGTIWDYMKKAARPPVPTSIDRGPDRLLSIRWDDGATTAISAHDLRANCPCAGCVDEVTHVRTLDVGAIPKDIDVAGLDQVGNYALHVDFTDGHGTGIYDWKLLRALTERPPADGTQPAR